jgi:hypothetical protein
MKGRISLTAGWKVKWLAPLVALLLLAGVAGAADHLLIPEEHPGPPSYARVLWAGYSQWRAFVFYRSPDSVPGDFNLGIWDSQVDPDLDFEASPMLMEGFGIWEDGTDPDVEAPYQLVLKDIPGQPVPIWFVHVSELYYDFYLNDRDGDGKPDYVVKIGDFDQMTSLRKGSADRFLEMRQPWYTTGGAQVPKINIVASGDLEGGGSFFMQFVWTNSPFWYPTQTTLRFEE